MKPIIFLLLSFLIFCFISCQSETVEDARKLSVENDFKLVKKEHYELKLPNYMEESFKLNPDASLQYMSEYKDEYIIVINESKVIFSEKIKEFEKLKVQKELINYRNTQFQFTEQKMKIINRSNFKSLRINGWEAETIEIDAKLEELKEPVSYYFYYIDGGEQLYTIMAWTLSSKKNIYREKVKKIIQQFKVLTPLN